MYSKVSQWVGPSYFVGHDCHFIFLLQLTVKHYLNRTVIQRLF